MIELQIDFRSFEEWENWRIQHESKFKDWTEDVVESVRTDGLREPVSEQIRAPEEVTIRLGDLRESLSSWEMNSRKRAGLLALDSLRRDPTSLLGRRTRILSAEGVTRAAMILRGTFPMFLGCEYLPTEEEQAAFFPIPHLDIQDISFGDQTFDLFYSSDVFEHVPDLEKAMKELYRVLRPGGVVVCTFPFQPHQQKTIVKAKIADGKVVLLTEPEYHGNPVRPDEGALVFSLPGWDFLDRVRDVGFEDAKYTLYSSSDSGITANRVPGVMVFSAIKSVDGRPVPGREVKGRLAAFAAPRARTYVGPKIRKLIGIASLPRSGSTVLTSVLSVHSRIKSVYEPWNATKAKETLGNGHTLEKFVVDFDVKMEGKDILLVKETTTNIRYAENVGHLLSSVFHPMERDCLVLIRNPLHVFLSEVEARREWWGEDGLMISAQIFDRWAERVFDSLRVLHQLQIQNNGLLVSYERLASDPDMGRRLVEAVGLSFEAVQTEYHSHLRTEDVRGDLGVAKAPRPLSADFTARREREVEAAIPIIAKSPYFDRIARFAQWVDEFATIGLSREIRIPVREVVEA